MLRLLLAATCRFQIGIQASPIDLIHYTVDVEDPSCGLCLHTDLGSFHGRILMNVANPGRALPGTSRMEQKR